MSDYLVHYGILGMKWGIRRTPEQLGRARAQKRSFRDKIRDTLNKRKRMKSSGEDQIKRMSDTELRNRVNRLILLQIVNTSTNHLR